MSKKKTVEKPVVEESTVEEPVVTGEFDEIPAGSSEPGVLAPSDR